MRALARRRFVLAPLVVVFVPVLWSLPATLRSERMEVRTYRTHPGAAEFRAPFLRYSGEWRVDADLVRFARLVERHVPADAIIVVAGSPNATWVRELAYAVAPRLIVTGGEAGWSIERAQRGAPPPPRIDPEGSRHVGRYRLVRL
jgi:hypothetical protein